MLKLALRESPGDSQRTPARGRHSGGALGATAKSTLLGTGCFPLRCCLCQPGIMSFVWSGQRSCPTGHCTLWTQKVLSDKQKQFRYRCAQPFGISAPHWKKSCLGPHIKYIVTRNHTQKNLHNVLSKFTILCRATFTAILGCMQPVGRRLHTPA